MDKKLVALFPLVSAFAVGVTTYRFADTLNLWWAVAVAMWSYNVWCDYKRVVQRLSETETHFHMTLKIPRRQSTFDREESLN